ncbi:hypothetical protein RB653_003976 [Dictyostelium firmibasis]|uniref:Mediator of RNA polymerase II transcription subunit 28 n=1 Tax=Dictyostelium firmibasis TaxID=79012 RepID=A0AAN7UIH5_9MYCE
MESTELNNNNNNNFENPIDLENDPNIFFNELNDKLESFILCLTKNDKENQIFVDEIIDKKVDDLLIASKDLENYFISLQSKYSAEKNKIQLKQELYKVKKEIENKDRLIERYKNKVKEWKYHFEPLYQSQNHILHSTAQGLSIENQFSPVFTPMPNTPSILQNLSQAKPSPSLGLGSTIL